MLRRSGIPRQLLALLVPVWLAGLAVATAAVITIATGELAASVLLGATLLLAVSMLAERYPVPLQDDVGGVSLGIVFSVSAVVLFGWAVGVVVCFLAPALVHLLERRPTVRAVAPGRELEGDEGNDRHQQRQHCRSHGTTPV
jgi:hypothetical protein